MKKRNKIWRKPFLRVSNKKKQFALKFWGGMNTVIILPDYGNKVNKKNIGV